MRYLDDLKKCKTPEQKYTFMNTIFRDAEIYLKKELGVIFPNFWLYYFSQQYEYDDLIKSLDGILGKKPYTKAMVVSSPNGIEVYVNLLDHRGNKPADFIVNLCTTFIEELIHIAFPMITETQVHDIVCAMVEGFIEINLPDDVKEWRLKHSKEFDESK
jgi:hypothetical protein